VCCEGLSPIRSPRQEEDGARRRGSAQNTSTISYRPHLIKDNLKSTLVCELGCKYLRVRHRHGILTDTPRGIGTFNSDVSRRIDNHNSWPSSGGRKLTDVRSRCKHLSDLRTIRPNYGFRSSFCEHMRMALFIDECSAVCTAWSALTISHVLTKYGNNQKLTLPSRKIQSVKLGSKQTISKTKFCGSKVEYPTQDRLAVEVREL
jgi:hypothetical protein